MQGSLLESFDITDLGGDVVLVSVNGRTDGRRTVSDHNSSLEHFVLWWAKNKSGIKKVWEYRMVIQGKIVC